MPADDTPITERSFVCPRCQTPTSIANIRCPNCGVNLGLAVAQAAQAVLKKTAADVTQPYEADRFLPRFGEFLLRNGDITQAQLEAALDRQKTGSGQMRTIGQILLEMGAVNREQLDRASLAQIKEIQARLRESQSQLAAQGKRVSQLEAALTDLVQFELSITDFVAETASRLQTIIAKLRPAEVELELTEAIADLNALAKDLNQYASKER